MSHGSVICMGLCCHCTIMCYHFGSHVIGLLIALICCISFGNSYWFMWSIILHMEKEELIAIYISLHLVMHMFAFSGVWLVTLL